MAFYGNGGGTAQINSLAVQFGDLTNTANHTKFEISDSLNTFTFGSFGNTAVFDVTGIATYRFNRTITATGTTGSTTINKPVGSVNFAAGSSSLVVTNNNATATSIILAVARTNDATCSVKNVVNANGSFTINMTATCTAETAVGFFVLN